MNDLLDLILGLLDLVYGKRWVAPFVLLPMMFLAAGWVHWRAVRMVRPYLVAAKDRVEAIRSALGDDDDPSQERRSFAANYLQVSTAMNADGKGAHRLVLAWREFQESMVDEQADPVRNTNRPAAFFNRAAPRLTMLTFSSNIFVGAGLILTFLGLIVALNTAARNMGLDIDQAKASLEHLLTVAGAKFFTSVAGLGASIWLRFAEHGLSLKVRKETDLICELLERGLLYVSPQRLAVEQLDVLREQRDQLKMFNTDFALQLSERIGQQFTQAIQPVANSLTALNDNMTSVTQGIGAGAREAIEKVSGEQLQGLSSTLADLTAKLDNIGNAVEGSSGKAAEQIRNAGADFKTAADDIKGAFEALKGDVEGVGTRLKTDGEAASTKQNEALSKIISQFERTQADSAEIINNALAELKKAGTDAATSMQGQLGDALKDGVEASQQTFKVALEESGKSLQGAADKLITAVSDAAGQVERASAGFKQSSDRADNTASAMLTVTDNARTAAASLGEAATGFANVTGPVAQAAGTLSQAALRIAQTIEDDRAADTKALAEMQALAEGVRHTHAAAAQAWQDYRTRFESVDRSLADATSNLAETLGDSLTEYRKFAQETDRELAAAVSKLGITLTNIEEYAEALDEYVEEVRGMQEAAE